MSVHRIYTWLLDSLKRGRKTLQLNGFPAQAFGGQTADYNNIESENQKSGLIILVLFHSACLHGTCLRSDCI